MIRKWLDKKMSNTQLAEAENFYQMLRGANKDVVSMVMVSTMYWAAVMNSKGTDLYSVSEWIEEEPMIAYPLGKLIKKVQQDDPGNATGLMVWLHTVRAAAYPELKHSARKIWYELQRSSLSTIDEGAAKAASLGIPNAKCTRHPPIDFEWLN